VSLTPILDLEQEPPKPRRRSRKGWIIAGSIYCLIVLALTVAQGLDLFEWPELPQAPSFDWLILLPALYVAILIHELGHLVAGKLAGMITAGFASAG
jgi:hypothetical protein